MSGARWGKEVEVDSGTVVSWKRWGKEVEVETFAYETSGF